jgi:hypothetical protein
MVTRAFAAAAVPHTRDLAEATDSATGLPSRHQDRLATRQSGTFTPARSHLAADATIGTREHPDSIGFLRRTLQ